MEPDKRKALEAAGWKFGDAADFLAMTDEERQMLDLRVDAALAVRRQREAMNLSQQELARRIHTSQPRIAKIEKAARDVTLDQILRAYAAAGGRIAISEVGGSRPSRIDKPCPGPIFSLQPSAKDDLHRLWQPSRSWRKHRAGARSGPGLFTTFLEGCRMCRGRVGHAAIALAILGLAALIVTPAVEGQKTKGKTRPAETKHLMAGICGPNCGALAKLLKSGPADDKAWGDAVRHAALLNELSYILMDDGRCPDKEWAGAAKTLRECSGKVLEAAQAKNSEAAQAAFKKMVGACATCHKAHKG